MGRRSDITTEEVIQAARQLTEQGKSVTKTGLRATIGRGRPDNLMAIYESFIAENGPLSLPIATEVTEQEDEIELPAELADLQSLLIPEVVSQLEAVFSRSNQLAHHIHGQRVNKEVQAARKRVQDAESELNSTNEQLADSFDQIEDLAEEVERLSTSESALKSELAQLREQLRQADGQLEKQETALADSRADGTAKAKEISQLQHDLTVAQEQNQQLSKALDDEKSAHAQSRTQAADQLSALQASLKSAQTALSESQATNAAQAAELNAANKANADLRESHQEWKAAIEQQQRQQAEQQQNQLAESQAEAKQSQAELKAAQSRCAELDKQLAVAQASADTAAELREQVNMLQQQLTAPAKANPAKQEDLLDRHADIVELLATHSMPEVAKLTNKSVSTVKRVKRALAAQQGPEQD